MNVKMKSNVSFPPELAGKLFASHGPHCGQPIFNLLENAMENELKRFCFLAELKITI